MPSATMLTRRLTGTTDRSGFYRNTHPESFPSPAHRTSGGGQPAKREIRTTFSVPTEGPAKRPCIADEEIDGVDIDAAFRPAGEDTGVPKCATTSRTND